MGRVAFTPLVIPWILVRGLDLHLVAEQRRTSFVWRAARDPSLPATIIVLLHVRLWLATSGRARERDASIDSSENRPIHERAGSDASHTDALRWS